jgi:vacuolar protein-sorting-associated protein 4
VPEARASFVEQKRHLLGKAQLLSPCSDDESIKGVAGVPKPFREVCTAQPRGHAQKIGKEEAILRKSLCDSTLRPRPNERFINIAGQEDAILVFQDHVLQRHLHKKVYRSVEKCFTSFLLYGPPGTGKSLLAKAVAGESHVHTFFFVTSSVLISKWQGESAKLVATLFQLAMERKPSIVFVDEVDSLALCRSSDSSDSTRRIKTELFMRLEDATKKGGGVTLIAACNRPWELDGAFLGRFESFLHIKKPTKTALFQLFAKEFSDPLLTDLNSSDFKKLATMAEG